MTHEMLHVSIESGGRVGTIVTEMALDECYEGQNQFISTNQLKELSPLVNCLTSFFVVIHLILYMSIIIIFDTFPVHDPTTETHKLHPVHEHNHTRLCD